MKFLVNYLSVLLTMPHLQDDTAQEKLRKETILGSVIGIDSSTSRIEELPIQVAKPNFLGTSDPVVAMVRKVSATVVDSSFESVEANDSESLMSPSSRRIIKTVITPSSSIGNISNSSASSDDVSAVEKGSLSTQKINTGPILTTVHSNSRLSHSPILVKRRVSQSESEESSDTPRHQIANHEILEESSSTRPAKIRRVSSQPVDVQPREGELLETKSKRVKSGDKNSTKADIINKRPVISPTTSMKKGEDPSTELRQSPQLGHHTHHILHQGFHPSAVIPPGFHPHSASFGGHPFGAPAGYPMAYPAYPPHVPPGAVHPFMGSQFHGHPATGFYASYPPGFHPHPMHQHSGQHLPSFVPPYGHPANAAAKMPSTVNSMIIEKKNEKSNPMTVMQSGSKSGVSGKATSANRCIPLQEPIPSKHWG